MRGEVDMTLYGGPKLERGEEVILVVDGAEAQALVTWCEETGEGTRVRFQAYQHKTKTLTRETLTLRGILQWPKI